MLVSLSANLYQHKKVNNLKTTSQIRSYTTPMIKDNVSFGDGGFGFVFLAARGGYEALKNGPKHANVSKFFKEVMNIIDNPVKNADRIPDMLVALSKMPDESTKGFYYSSIDIFKEQTNKSAFDIKQMILKKSLLSDIPDNNNIIIESKKDFVRSLFNEGHEISSDFINQFKKLDDNIYKNFKQEIVDKCLFSKKYAQKKKERFLNSRQYLQTDLEKYLTPKYDLCGRICENAESLRRTISLIETLDENVHWDYLNKIMPAVIASKREIFNSLKNNNLYTLFQRNFDSPELIKDLYPKDNYAKLLLSETIKQSDLNKETISKTLNMDINLVDDLFVDLETKKQLSNIQNNEEKVFEIFKNRIQTKLNSPTPEIRFSAIDWCRNSNNPKLIQYLEPLTEEKDIAVKFDLLDLLYEHPMPENYNIAFKMGKDLLNLKKPFADKLSKYDLAVPALHYAVIVGKDYEQYTYANRILDQKTSSLLDCSNLIDSMTKYFIKRRRDDLLVNLINYNDSILSFDERIGTLTKEYKKSELESYLNFCKNHPDEAIEYCLKFIGFPCS